MFVAMLMGAFAAEAPEGSPFADVPFFHHSAVRPTKRAEPEYPAVSEQEGAERHRCMVWVKIGPDGSPAQTTILEAYPGKGCTAPFQAAATAAVSQWKWKPVKIDKVKSTVHTQIAVLFDSQQLAPLVDVSLEARPPPEPIKQPKRGETFDPVTGLPVGTTPAQPTPAPAPEPEPAPAPVEMPAPEPMEEPDLGPAPE